MRSLSAVPNKFGQWIPQEFSQGGQWVLIRGTEDEPFPLPSRGPIYKQEPGIRAIVGSRHQPFSSPSLGLRPWLRWGPAFLSSSIHPPTRCTPANPAHLSTTGPAPVGCSGEGGVKPSTELALPLGPPQSVTARLSARCLLKYTHSCTNPPSHHSPGPCSSHRKPHLLSHPQAPSPSRCA